jgi:hypothetical protein
MGVDTGPEIRGFRAARALYRTRDGLLCYNGDLTCESASNRAPAGFCLIPLIHRLEPPHWWGPNRRRSGPHPAAKSAKQLNTLGRFMSGVPPQRLNTSVMRRWRARSSPGGTLRRRSRRQGACCRCARMSWRRGSGPGCTGRREDRHDRWRIAEACGARKENPGGDTGVSETGDRGIGGIRSNRPC